MIHDECIMEPSNLELERLRLRVLELEARLARVRETLTRYGRCGAHEAEAPLLHDLWLALDGEVTT